MKRFFVLLGLVAGCFVQTPPITFGAGEVVPEYSRDEWGRWIDVDKDCQDTRQEVLIAESLVPVTFETEKACRVKTGKWIDPYTGTTYESPSELEIDHTVALREVHYAGGWKWTPEQKRAYYNDLSNPHHLVAAGVSVNRSKGARPPETWMPTDPTKQCAYIVRRLSVILAWNVDVSHDTYVELLLKYCR